MVLEKEDSKPEEQELVKAEVRNKMEDEFQVDDDKPERFLNFQFNQFFFNSIFSKNLLINYFFS